MILAFIAVCSYHKELTYLFIYGHFPHQGIDPTLIHLKKRGTFKALEHGALSVKLNTNNTRKKKSQEEFAHVKF
jgi:hypothetical protein